MTALALPAGFVMHCESCGIVVPADAPRSAVGADCAWVAQHRMAWFDPKETVKGQHTQATAAWKLIHHAAVEGPAPDAACVAYWQQYRKDPKQHFASSAARNALTPVQVAAQTSTTLPPAPSSSKEFRAWKVAVARLGRVRRDRHFYV